MQHCTGTGAVSRCRTRRRCYDNAMRSGHLHLMLLICGIIQVATGQVRFHAGVEAGIPLTDTLPSSLSISTSPTSTSLDRFNSVTKRLLIGPAFRVDLEHGLGIEFDALYQRVNYDHAVVSSSSLAPLAPSGFSSQSFEQTTANRWQFPLLIQYTRTLAKAKAFVEAGPSISHMGGSRSIIRTSTVSGSSRSSSTTSVNGQGTTSAGVTVGAGVDLPLFGLHLRPEFRYSHWFSPATGSFGAPYGAAVFTGVTPGVSAGVPSSLRTNQNEASFLLGLTF